MANWLENLTGQASTVLDTIQDVVDVVGKADTPAATQTSTPAVQSQSQAAASSGIPANYLLVGVVVVVLAIVLLR